MSGIGLFSWEYHMKHMQWHAQHRCHGTHRFGGGVLAVIEQEHHFMPWAIGLGRKGVQAVRNVLSLVFDRNRYSYRCRQNLYTHEMNLASLKISIVIIRDPNPVRTMHRGQDVPARCSPSRAVTISWPSDFTRVSGSSSTSKTRFPGCLWVSVRSGLPPIVGRKGCARPDTR